MRLKGVTQRYFLPSEPSFQFQTGAIKRVVSSIGGWYTPSFQFQTGAIKSKASQRTTDFFCEFQFQTGAIKSSPGSSSQFCNQEFQFQTGAIKSRIIPAIYVRDAALFQFQTGAIKSAINHHNRVICKGFNSKLVRLKVGVGIWISHSRVTGFNSKLVRLKAMARGISRATLIDVSIPNWCD